MNYFTRASTTQSPAASKGIKEILSLVQSDLKRVDGAIREQAGQFDESISAYVAYALESSGKRLRPALALMVGGATGGITSAHVDLAVIVEMIHLATLVHDDIMDGADTRRGQPTPNARWGNAITVLLGDCLFAHALDLSTRFDNTAISRTIARAANAVCTGEIMQTQRRFDLNLSREDYFRIIEMKTAALFGCAAELGAWLSGGQPEVVESMRRFGLKLGTAYQVYDDCLDMAGDSTQAGKTLGTDLQKGKLTLPVLNLLQSATPADLAVYSQIILRAEEPESVAITAAARRSGALREAIHTGVALVEDAERSLACLRPGPHAEGLHAIARIIAQMMARFEEEA